LLIIRTSARFEAFPIQIASDLFMVTGALLAFWFAGVGHIPSERAIFKRVLLIGVIVSAIAIIIGFALQLIYMLQQPRDGVRYMQGAWLAFARIVGLFVTGPLGFAAGCIGGFTWVRYRHAKAPRILTMPLEVWVDRLRDRFFCLKSL
jgi:hypothetical protein